MISVCIASYNGEKYIKEQLQSILVQLSADDEIIVSDDNSADNTRGIIMSMGDDRIKIISGPALGSPVFNFENALKHAKGEFIFLSDQDDVWMSNKVELFMEALQQYDLVLSDCQVVDKDLIVLKDSYFSILPPKLGIWNNLYKNHFLGSCMAFRRKVLRYVLPFPSKIVMHDIWIGLCVSAFGKVGIINVPLMKYRRHDSVVSFAAGESGNTFVYKIWYRIGILYALIDRIIKYTAK